MELTEGTELGARESGVNGVVNGSNVQSNLVLGMPLSCSKVTIGSPEGTVDDSVDGWKVGISLGTVISDTLGYAADPGYRAFIEGGFGLAW